MFFRTVIEIWRAQPEMDAQEFARRRGGLEEWLDRLLAAERTQPGDVAVRKRIEKRRGSILTCLYEPAAEPTNNRAERNLRPAVIARTLSCWNKTEAGKRSFDVLRSVASSCCKRGDLRHDQAESLSRLKAGADGVPVSDGVEHKPVVFLAEVTGDLDDQHEEVGRYLLQAGLHVVPEGIYPRDPSAFRAAREGDLARATLVVQVLSGLAGKRLPGASQSIIGLQ